MKKKKTTNADSRCLFSLVCKHSWNDRYILRFTTLKRWAYTMARNSCEFVLKSDDDVHQWLLTYKVKEKKRSEKREYRLDPITRPIFSQHFDHVQLESLLYLACLCGSIIQRSLSLSLSQHFSSIKIQAAFQNHTVTSHLFCCLFKFDLSSIYTILLTHLDCLLHFSLNFPIHCYVFVLLLFCLNKNAFLPFVLHILFSRKSILNSLQTLLFSLYRMQCEQNVKLFFSSL